MRFPGVSRHVWTCNILLKANQFGVILTQVQIEHKGQDCSFVLRQTVLVDWNHQLHKLSSHSIQDNHFLAYPYLPKYRVSVKTGDSFILTFQFYTCFWWILSIHDFRKINFLKNDFSILPGHVPLNSIILNVIQFSTFLDDLTIKFGEYNHQRNWR